MFFPYGGGLPKRTGPLRPHCPLKLMGRPRLGRLAPLPGRSPVPGRRDGPAVSRLFVIETMSVIIQVLYYQRTKKRIFLMAPIHHHFEKKGWAEPQIVIRFWIISVILAMIGLATLKVR